MSTGSKGFAKIIVVVMEETMKRSHQWTGPLLVLMNNVFLKLYSDADLDEVVLRLEAIARVGP